jgi:hypothetical protein
MASETDGSRWLFSAEQLANTPTIQDGMTKQQVGECFSKMITHK